jgi:hypothetical protein
MIGALIDRIVNAVATPAAAVETVPQLRQIERPDDISGIKIIDNVMVALLGLTNRLASYAEESTKESSTH